ncbi:T-cell surface glycoprotein CD3 epsilon chain-like [Epinephelus moara]|uniref:T-cell surface glycoprotein CD3 epsilon chain-like n=1 Tax=Epinephelus moara TaxID=300413 RepID=UPI00214E7C81|nr:T-cell surface glycoprotein CD3 epsilon chain-like [Epinephelus moara]
MGVRATLAVLLLFIATVEADDGKGGVEFWREEFTMTCPQAGTWYNKKGELPKTGENEKEEKYKLTYDGKNRGSFYCEYDDDKTKYYFYVKGKACKNCFELDTWLFGLAIVVDVLGTAGLMIFIFSCTKKKSSAQPSHTSKAPARSGGRGPPVPNPDYETLNMQNRAQDHYSFLNRTGQ